MPSVGPIGLPWTEIHNGGVFVAQFCHNSPKQKHAADEFMQQLDLTISTR